MRSAAAVVPPEFSGCRSILFPTSRPQSFSAVSTLALCSPAVRAIPATPSIFFVTVRDFSSATDNNSGGSVNPPPPDHVRISTSPSPPKIKIWSTWMFWFFSLNLICICILGMIVMLTIMLLGTSTGLSVVFFIWSKLSGSRNHEELIKNFQEMKESFKGFSQVVKDFVEIFPHQFMVVAQQIYDAIRSDDSDEKEKVQKLKKIVIAVLKEPEIAEVIAEHLENSKVAEKTAVAILEKQKQEKEQKRKSSWFPWW